MEILQLRYFFESAQNESFAKTAEKYLVPATSVSAAVKRLEKELGCTLFDRSSNRIRLNENGKKLQNSLCLVFAELDGVADRFAAQRSDEGEIRLLVRAMRRNITDGIIEFSQQNPHVSFKTVFDFHETDFGSYDVIIDEETDAYSEYERFELYSVRLRLKCAAGDELCGKRLLLGQLCSKKFVSMGEESNLHKYLISACNRAGFTPDIAVSCNDIECYDKFIAAGMGIALGRETDKRKVGVADLNVTDFDERYTVYCYYKKAANYGVVQRFLDFLKEKTK